MFYSVVCGLITACLQKNSHRLTLTMSPDSEYLQKEMAAEKDREKKASAELSNADRVDIVARGEGCIGRCTSQLLCVVQMMSDHCYVGLCVGTLW